MAANLAKLSGDGCYQAGFQLIVYFFLNIYIYRFSQYCEMSIIKYQWRKAKKKKIFKLFLVNQFSIGTVDQFLALN